MQISNKETFFIELKNITKLLILLLLLLIVKFVNNLILFQLNELFFFGFVE